MTTLYLAPEEVNQEVWDAAKLAGWDRMRVSHELLNHMAPPEVKRKVIYGDSTFALDAAEKLNVNLHTPSFEYLANVPAQWLNCGHYFFYFDGSNFVPQNTFHPKKMDSLPTNCATCLPVQIQKRTISLGVIVCDKIQTAIGFVENSPDMDIEFRCFANHGEVMTLAPYRHNYKPTNMASDHEWYEAESFANRFLADRGEKNPIVLDVGYILGRGWGIMRVLPAWYADIGNCIPELALTNVIKDATIN